MDFHAGIKRALAEVKKLADESQAHGSFWERILTNRLEELKDGFGFSFLDKCVLDEDDRGIDEAPPPQPKDPDEFLGHVARKARKAKK
jgi:hypothetical protein